MITIEIISACAMSGGRPKKLSCRPCCKQVFHWMARAWNVRTYTLRIYQGFCRPPRAVHISDRSLLPSGRSGCIVPPCWERLSTLLTRWCALCGSCFSASSCSTATTCANGAALIACACTASMWAHNVNVASARSISFAGPHEYAVEATKLQFQSLDELPRTRAWTCIFPPAAGICAGPVSAVVATGRAKALLNHPRSMP